MQIVKDECLTFTLNKRFNKKIISSHKNGLLLKGKWELIQNKYEHFLLSPIIPEILSIDGEEINDYIYDDESGKPIFLVAIRFASSNEMMNKELYVHSGFVNIYLISEGDDTLVVVVWK